VLLSSSQNFLTLQMFVIYSFRGL